ncbi:hypothetical protein SAMN05216299_12162 [Nitrosospira sp. Nsp14]|nr:hypothetical protein SAMN05216299_12162 [Nitrosospira sp. Nsp14]
MAYTNSELAVKSVLFNFLRLPEKEFAILVEFGRLKVPDMATIIKNLLDQRPEYEVEKRHELIWALNKFDSLSQLRNTYVHWLWMPYGEEAALVSIKSKMNPPEDPYIYVNLEALQEAESELQNVVAVLAQFYFDLNPDMA